MLHIISSLNRLNPINYLKTKYETTSPLRIIYEVALAAIDLCVTLILARTFPNLAPVAFFVGIAFSHEVRKVIQNVNTVFEGCKSKFEKFLLY